MRFQDIRGNEDVCKALAGMVDSGKVPHAIMLHEDDGGGAFAIALAFLDYLYGGNPRIGKLIHPDLHFIFPTAAGSISEQYLAPFRSLAGENVSFTESQLSAALGIEGKSSMIAVSEAKHLLDVLSLSALEGGYRAVIIYLPEKMNQEAANRLLKLIEEPPALTQFLLITHAPEKVLLTIASRCQRIRVVPSESGMETLEFSDSDLFFELMGALAAGNLGAALEAGEKIALLPSKESHKLFCKFAAVQLRRMFLVQQGLSELGASSPETDAMASRFKKSFPRQALEALSQANSLINRNVNVRIVFTDLVNRLYMNL